MANLPPLHSYPAPPGAPGLPPHEVGPSPRERIARAKTLVRRAAGHWKLGLLILVIGCAVAVVAALNSVRTYRSECVVQFKAGLRMGDKDDDSPTDRASRLAPKLKDELTTRARLETVIKEFNLYPKIVDARGMGDAVEEMRDKHVGFRGKGDASTFVISFESEDPEVAQKVTQRLADTMIDEYTKGNLSAVTAQEQFLANEEARSEAELEAANKAFAKFLAAHPEFAQEMKKGGGVTPGTGGSSPIVMPTAVQSGDPQLEALKRQRARIEAEIKAVQTGAPPPLVGTPGQEARLAKARRDRDEAQKAVDDATSRLATLRAQGLKDDWPDVKAAQNELSRTKAQVAAADGAVREAEQEIRFSAGTFPTGKVDVDELRQRLDGVDAQIAARRAGKAPPKPAVDADASVQAPEPVSEIVELETEWQRLLRTLQESKENHDELKQKLERARLEKSRAQAKGGDTMLILDPAYRPTKPSKGGKSKVALTGGALALLVALLYAFARVIFNDTMIDAQDIEALKLIPVLGVLPAIPRAGVNGALGAATSDPSSPNQPSRFGGAKGGAPGAL
jgi:hypothetical protein